MLKKLEDEIFEAKDEENYLSPYLRDDFLDAYITRGASHDMIFEEDVITPHSDDITKNPIPIKFLKVRANVTFAFRFDVQDSCVLPVLTKEKKLELIKQIILREKLGAKTTFGYGKFVE
jgi:CRISPR-associated protein Cmr6